MTDTLNGKTLEQFTQESLSLILSRLEDLSEQIEALEDKVTDALKDHGTGYGVEDYGD